MPHDVFISYSSVNSAEAQAICAALEAAGLACWIAPRSIVAGEDWATSIIQGINGCRTMLLLLSSHSNTSPQVANEIERATHKRVPILTVRLEELALTPHLEYFLSSRHWFDAIAPPLAAHLPQLVRTVRQALATLPGDQAVVAVVERRASPAAQSALSVPFAQSVPSVPLPPPLMQAQAVVSPPVLPNNLPQQMTSFIGREKEMEAIKSLLDTTRLLTLTGSGGCGKTRLGLQVAAEVLEHYPDGAWFVELAPLVEAALVPQTLALALNVTEEPGKPLVQTLAAALKARRLLIVLDNCEHLLDACARLLDALLRACPHIKALAPSRAGLGIGGETVYRIPSLSLPDLKHTATPATLSRCEAARLFVERALAVHPAFAVTNANAPALASLCHRLDGIPFAIELAAARVRALSVEEINSKLDNRFRLLTGGSRASLPRQQTLRALIDWSYDLLTPQEKTLLRRLSVFAGGWTLEASEQVGAGESGTGGSEAGESIEDWEILDLLTSLADKSLVLAQVQNETTRYRLLETVRQYARDRLTESGEMAAVRARHGDYFLTLAEKIRPKLTGPEQAQGLDVLEEEHDNLRQALAFYAEDDKENGENGEEDAQTGDKGLRLGAALQGFWWTRGYLSEGRERLAAVLAHAGGQEATKARADALNGAGVLAQLQGDYAEARVLHEQSLAIQRALGDMRGVAISLSNMGSVAMEQSDYGGARVLYEQSLAIRRTLGEKRGIALSLNDLGSVAMEQGDYDGARVLAEESLAIARELGDKRNVAITLVNLGGVALDQGDGEGARGLLEECLTTAREAGDRRVIAFGLEAFASLAVHGAHEERAARLWGAAAALRESIGSPLPPADREKQERQAAGVQKSLSEDAFALVSADGRIMTMEQAIAYAIENSVS